jgi:hypothetical protein
MISCVKTKSPVRDKKQGFKRETRRFFHKLYLMGRMILPFTARPPCLSGLNFPFAKPHEMSRHPFLRSNLFITGSCMVADYFMQIQTGTFPVMALRSIQLVP